MKKRKTKPIMISIRITRGMFKRLQREAARMPAEFSFASAVREVIRRGLEK